ncbi:hypothetical protein DBV08_15320 [Rhodococcus sp. KBW08]|uniref:hypothetical protein n=1 Tax=Rhodococcus sp. KBW08 TaxID=2144188 RepID=UPI000F5998A2|nr:hypothetical protein [Rhodococcus sp. KBW08]RQO46842.1 hypothetical protein DBV08_15320 [Rhodococcus sp. KBW08]
MHFTGSAALTWMASFRDSSSEPDVDSGFDVDSVINIEQVPVEATAPTRRTDPPPATAIGSTLIAAPKPIQEMNRPAFRRFDPVPEPRQVMATSAPQSPGLQVQRRYEHDDPSRSHSDREYAMRSNDCSDDQSDGNDEQVHQNDESPQQTRRHGAHERRHRKGIRIQTPKRVGA